MTRRIVALALMVLVGGTCVRSTDAQFMGPGYGMGMGGYGMGPMMGLGGYGMGGYGMGMGPMMGMGGYGMGGYGMGGYGMGGYGMGGYGMGFGGVGGPFAMYPYASMTFMGPMNFNPLFGMGLSPYAVFSAMGEASLRGPQRPVGILADPNAPKIPTTPGSTVTIATPGQKTYTYKIVTP